MSCPRSLRESVAEAAAEPWKPSPLLPPCEPPPLAAWKWKVSSFLFLNTWGVHTMNPRPGSRPRVSIRTEMKARRAPGTIRGTKGRLKRPDPGRELQEGALGCAGVGCVPGHGSSSETGPQHHLGRVLEEMCHRSWCPRLSVEKEEASLCLWLDHATCVAEESQ